MSSQLDTMWILQAHGVIEDPDPIAESDRILAERVIKYVAKEADITTRRLKSKSREREAVMARQCVYLTLKARTALSLEKIGELVGMRDHATVLHALRTTHYMTNQFTSIQEDSQMI